MILTAVIGALVSAWNGYKMRMRQIGMVTDIRKENRRFQKSE
jgi:hypothetical protein